MPKRTAFTTAGSSTSCNPALRRSRITCGRIRPRGGAWMSWSLSLTRFRGSRNEHCRRRQADEYGSQGHGISFDTHAVALCRKIVFGKIAVDDRFRSVGTCGHLTLVRLKQEQPLKRPPRRQKAGDRPCHCGHRMRGPPQTTKEPEENNDHRQDCPRQRRARGKDDDQQAQG